MRLISRTSPPALIDALSSIVQIQLPKALAQSLSVLVLELRNSALKAFSNQDAQAFDEAINFCDLHGPKLVRECVKTIQRGLSITPSFGQQVQTGNEELALVEYSKFEAQLLVDTVVRTVREALAEHELNLCGCFSQMIGRHIANAENPFSLDYLLHSWLKGFNLGARTEPVRNVFLAQMCAVLPQSLATYFKALSAEFAQQQISPLLPSSTFAINQERDAVYEVSEQSNPEGALSTIQCEVLKSILHCQPPANGWTAGSLLQHLESSGFHLNERQREDTHLVSGVFQSLQQEPVMVETLNPALQKLLLPVLDATLRESGALSDENHPVRGTLDRLLQLAGACAPPNKSLEARVDTLIDRLVANYRGNSHSFSMLNIELEELIELQQRTYRRRVERVVQIYRGQETLFEARRDVDQGLSEALGAYPPKLLLQWLQMGWRDLLVHKRIRAGRDNNSWLMDLDLIRRLADYLLSPTSRCSPDERLARERDVDHLVSTICWQLDEFGIANAGSKLILEKLREQIVSGQVVELGELCAPHVPSSPVSSELQDCLESLEEGDWLQDADGHALQLIWRSVNKDRYLLVDNKGAQVSDLTSVELSERVAKGQLQIEQSGSRNKGVIQRTLQDLVGRLYREIAHARSHDELTGLLNRQSFEGLVVRSLSCTGNTAYFIAQIDQFSVLNSHAGVMAGDACLKHVALVLQQILPNEGSCARLGGGEFAAMIPECDEADAFALAETLGVSIAGKTFNWQDQSHAITLSIGVAQRVESDDLASVFSHLYTACNLAKESGRNQVHRFSVSEYDERVRLSAIAARVDDIIKREDISLRVQQIARAELNSLEVPHYELLLVMENELPLHDFITAAERYNRMGKVDHWVLIRAFSQLEKAPDLWDRCSSISINLSGSSLNDERLLSFIEGLFTRYAIEPRRICFEITETAAVANLARVADLIRQLQRLGCSFALDDFGVGFSSFDYLKRLPVDIVKIDGSFVREITHSQSDLAMVRSINEIAHELGRVTVAEYVEDQATRQLLIEIGVDFVQGYGVQMPRSFLGLLSDI